jgi:hypothetical protein
MWRTIEQLYGGNLGCGEEINTSAILSQTLQLEQDLVAWECMLEKPLQPIQIQGSVSDVLDTPSFIVERFNTILTMRRHNVHLLIHRPLLIKLLNYDDARPWAAQELALLRQATSRSVQSAMVSALETIMIVHTNLLAGSEQRKNLLGAWWYTLYYSRWTNFLLPQLSTRNHTFLNLECNKTDSHFPAFNASLILATILLACYRSPATSLLVEHIDLQEIRRTLDNATAALQQLDSGSRITTKCEQYLAKLLWAIDACGRCPRTKQLCTGCVLITVLSTDVSRTGDRSAVYTETLESGWPASGVAEGADISATASQEGWGVPGTTSAVANLSSMAEVDFDWDSFLADPGQEFFVAG